ncbi:MAG: NAD(+)/NADH kinase [Planctomycetota bacterium]|jgi:NAD+ kinase
MRRRVILLGDERKEGVRPALDAVRGWIGEMADLVAVDLTGELDLRSTDADLLVIFGGDGSLLAAARRMGDDPIPAIGVNFGKFGYLTDIRARDVREELSEVLEGEYVVEERLMLSGRIRGEDGVQEFLALNEFYVGPSIVGRMVTLELSLDGEYATTYRGDGLVVATPTGSTGHSLSAGGPIVDPGLEAILLTPVSPHSLTNRPLLLPPDVTVTLRAEPDHGREHVTFNTDGQVTTPMKLTDTAEITRARHRFPLVKTGLRTRYDVLRDRLGWSGQPPYSADAAEPS